MIHPQHMRLLALYLTVLACLLGGASAHAQFGKNKVQYRTFDWKYIQSEHFDIYFYDSAGVNLSRFCAYVAEEMLGQLEHNWRYRVTARIPIVVYNSKNDFQQTNVVGEYLPEGVGGVTELFKNRVTVPFEGEWSKFRHVIRHELVHAVLNDKFYGGTLQALISNNIRFYLPIWMNEGLAEFEARNGYDVETDMFIRDAVLGEFLPPLDGLGGYFAYRGGQAFYWYVEQTYGHQKIGELLNRCKASGDLDLAFRGSFGKSVEEFSEQWKYDMKKLYFPDIASRSRAVDFALPLTHHDRDESFFNTSPALSPSGDRLAWISDRNTYRSVYVLDVANPGRSRLLIEGEEDVDFEELHLLTPAISWSPDGKRIALAVKSGGSDAIFVIGVDDNERERIDVELDAIYSVDWSADGHRIAFQGIRGDQSDIYVFDLEANTLLNLTDDIFSDAEPNWSADGRSIYFVSDRREYPIRRHRGASFRIWNHDYAHRDIYSIDVDADRLERLTFDSDVLKSSPTPLGTDQLLYVSDANGIANMYVMDLVTGGSRPLTNALSGIAQLTATRDGAMAAFTAWNGDGQDVFLVRNPLGMRADADSLPRTTYYARARFNSGPVDTGADIPSAAVTCVTPLTDYGDVRIDLSDSPNLHRTSRHAAVPDPPAQAEIDHRLYSGDFDVADYRILLTPDVIQATGAYTSFYGVQGVTQLLFSDMLGDHQIYLASSLLLDLKNSDFLASYSYLPERIDYSVDAFHSSRFIGLYDAKGAYVLTRFRQYGLTGRASNPFDRFRRIDMGITFVRAAREPVDNGEIVEQGRVMVVPTVSYVFDNTRAWAFNPASGSRYYGMLLASPRLGAEGVGFYSALCDVRHYVPLSRAGDVSLGLRLSAGASFGSNPQKFFVGGVENWLNYSIRRDELPITEPEDFIYATPGYPLRGYAYSQQVGSKFALGNVEFRFPLVRALVTGPAPVLLQYVSGVLFVDAGTAWNESLSLVTSNRAGEAVTDDLLVGAGAGARAYVFGIPLRMDVAWRYTIENWSEPYYYFSLGYDF